MFRRHKLLVHGHIQTDACTHELLKNIMPSAAIAGKGITKIKVKKFPAYNTV